MSIAITADCVNPDSYGLICVGCNQCGRAARPVRRQAVRININEDVWHPTVQYGRGEEAPIYYRVCPICGRFVRADDRSSIPEYVETNATCIVHGRVKMPFCGWAYEEDEYEH